MKSIPFLIFLAVAPIAIPVAASAATCAAAVDAVDELLKSGRALLAEGRQAEALAKFEEAAKSDPSLRTRQWILRAWIAQGRVNDVLNEVDALAKTEKGEAIDYLYGMAFAKKAKNHIAEGNTGGVVAMAFDDAVEFLRKASAAQPDLYADAFPALAESAWYSQKLDVARAAADKSVALRPKDGDAWHMLGKVAFSQYTALRGGGGEGEPAPSPEELEKPWTTARDAFTKAAEIFGTSAEPVMRAKAAEASMQIGWLHVWKQQGLDAAKRFATAIALDPASADFARLRETLTPDQFVVALEQAAEQYESLYGKESAGDATLVWWLGFGRFVAKSYEDAEKAFTKAVAKAPAFANSWYYIALSRYFRQDYDGAIAALRTHHGISADDAAASLRANLDENLRILDYMVGMKAGKAANLDAAFLSELQTLMAPEVHRYWNNLGLFLRDEGEARERRNKETTPEEHKQIVDLYERSFVAYKKSLELAPDDPNYLNDAALMLHFHLDRDLDQARAWYVKAIEMAQVELAKTDLSKEDRPLREIALRDAKNNLRDLDKILEARKGGGTPPSGGEKPPQ